MTFGIKLATALAAAISLSSPSLAQGTAEFRQAFSGDWYVFDSAASSAGQICLLSLSDEGAAPWSATAANCVAPLDGLASWSIQNGQIVLAAADTAAPIAAIGGNQFRLSGEVAGSGRTIIVERQSGDGTAARIAQALAAHTCFFKGLSGECATSEELVVPSSASAGATIQTYAPLNVRSLPRRDAPVIGTIPAEAEVQADQCMLASDGVWCRAEFSGEVGFFARSALRQNTWPVATFRVTTE